MAEEKRKISELPSNDSPSTSTVLVGVDGGDTVKIPITEFVLSGSTDDITISTGRDIEISANDAVEISANRTLGITAVDHITVESSNTMSLNSDGANISFLPDGDMELFADGNIDLYSDNYVSLTSNGDTSITSEGSISVNTPGYLGMWGDQTGLYGTNCIEFIAGENDESYLYADGDCMQIMSPKTSLHNVDVIYTKNNGCGQSGQVLTTDGSTVYWGNPSGGGSGGSTPMTYITHAELKALRDNGQLIPGMFYRITDYQCTTSQENTRAMNNRFDIIVQALSEDRLSEIAKADFNDEDSYFADNGANLAAWEIKYCLDDDATRFAWASADLQITENIQPFYAGEILVRAPEMDWTFEYGDYPYAWTAEEIRSNGSTDNRNYVYTTTVVPTVNTSCAICKDGGWDYDGLTVLFNISGGKGVIYYMKDEHGNECPYDFKNIQFKRYLTHDEEGYPQLDEEDGDEIWAYTFYGVSYNETDGGEIMMGLDGSTEGYWGNPNIYDMYCFHSNVIKEQRYDDNLCETSRLRLNDIVLLGRWSINDAGVAYSECCYDNVFEQDCFSITLGTFCFLNHFEYWNFNITFGGGCSGNKTGCNCANISAGDWLCESTFNSGCSFITIGWYCDHITFGTNSSDNTIDGDCDNISIGRNCHYNTISSGCINLTLGNFCDENFFGVDAYSVVLENHCRDNFIDDCVHNITLVTYLGGTTFNPDMSGPDDGMDIYEHPRFSHLQI